MVAAIVAVGALVHATVMARYGFHRDEFYYIETGRRLAWGYVDQPPVTPLLARVAAALPGSDLLALRALAILAAAACVVMVSLLAREFGGGRRAQVIAAAIAAAAPAFVGPSFLFGTTITDDVAWCAVFLLVTRALRTGRTTSWLAAGVAAGIGLENKRTLAVLLVGIAVGLAVTRREVLRDRGPWLAAAVAAVLLAPNVIWDASNGWSTFAFTKVLADKIGGPLGEIGQLAQVPLVVGLLVLPFVVVGIRWLWTDPDGRPHRWTLVCAGVVLVLFAIGLGKVYYPVPAVAPLFAAGAVAVERRAWRNGVIVALLVPSWLTTMFVALPFVPVTVASHVPGLKDLAVESYGWPEFTDQVAAAARALPPADRANLVVFAGSYGETGALRRYGPARGLTAPIRSGHNAYGDWGPQLSGSPPPTVLCIELRGAERYLHRGWRDVQVVARIRIPHHPSNEETRFGATIYTCRSPLGSWNQIWPRLTHLDGHLRNP